LAASCPRSISLEGADQPPEEVEKLMRKIAVLALTAGALALSAAGTAVAAPTGPEGPTTCTFSKGMTTCVSSTASVLTITQSGCTVNGSSTTTTTTYTAHQGTYNSNGTAAGTPITTYSDPVVVNPSGCGPPPSFYQACTNGGGIYSMDSGGSRECIKQTGLSAVTVDALRADCALSSDSDVPNLFLIDTLSVSAKCISYSF
jgi:hypothetical protein